MPSPCAAARCFCCSTTPPALVRCRCYFDNQGHLATVGSTLEIIDHTSLPVRRGTALEGLPVGSAQIACEDGDKVIAEGARTPQQADQCCRRGARSPQPCHVDPHGSIQSCPQDGKMFITTKGRKRFQIKSVVKEKPVLLCEVEMVDEDDDSSAEVCSVISAFEFELVYWLWMQLPQLLQLPPRVCPTASPTLTSHSPSTPSQPLTMVSNRPITTNQPQLKELAKEVSDLMRNTIRLNIKLSKLT